MILTRNLLLALLLIGPAAAAELPEACRAGLSSGRSTVMGR